MLKALGNLFRGAPAADVPSPPAAAVAARRQERPGKPYLTLPRPAVAVNYTAFENLPGSDPAVLAAVGVTVSATLSRDPAAVKLSAVGVDMFLVEDFLTPDECARLITLIDADVKPSTSLRAPGTPTRRTSETCRLPVADPLVAAVEERIARLLGLPGGHSETIQGQRYRPGQFFKIHNDYVAGGREFSTVFAGEGGQRTWTAMVFLDEPDQGGNTSFPRALIEVRPRTGALLTWNNMAADGNPNALSHHEGTPVIAGTKHVLTKWFRERPWTSSAASDALRA